MAAKIVKLLPLTALFYVLMACATPASESAVEGYVVEEGTNKPITGVIVVGHWLGTVSIVPADSRTVCRHVESATTDEQGHYRLPNWEGKEPNLTYSYKRGYERSEQYFRTKAYLEHKDILRPFEGGKEKRLDYLEKVSRASACPDAGHSKRNLYPFYRGIFAEAKALVETDEDKRTLQWIRRLAAYAAIAEDRVMTQREADQLAEQYLRDNFQ